MDKENNLDKREKPSSYYDPRNNILEISDFYTDTIGEVTTENFESLNKIIELTSHIQDGSTTTKNLEACREIIEKYGISFDDETYALDITALRILKNLPSIWAETGYLVGNTKEEAIYVLEKDCESLILEKEKVYLREELKLTTGEVITRDANKRRLGKNTNIQRHVSRKELGVKVLPAVRDIFLKIVNF
jgi:hypothetical protein